METPPVETPPTPPATDEPARRRLWAHVRSHPARYGVLAAVVVAVLAVVLFWFQPQTLLFDRVVDEEFPAIDDPDPAPPSADEAPDQPAAGADADEAEEDDAPEPADGEDDLVDDTSEEETADAGEVEPTGPQVLATGRFESRNRYTVEGQTSVYELEDGSRVLRFEEFSSTNGPDLLVYLTASDQADGDDDLNADYVDLGVLSGNVGNQNYDIPDDVDLDHYDTAVIWCRRFTVGFGAADLHPVDAGG